jgi:hypothetical protein
MEIAEDVKLRKRPGESGRGQQVWIAWKYSTAKERAFAVEELKRLPEYQKKITEALARPTDHPTARAAAASIRHVEITQLESIVYNAVERTGKKGIIWDEVGRVTRVRLGSISPRWKSLRKQKLILAALVE